MIDKISLVGDKGKIYKQLGAKSQSFVDNKKTKVSLNFEATTFDNIGDLKMISKDANVKDIEIKLVK